LTLDERAELGKPAPTIEELGGHDGEQLVQDLRKSAGHLPLADNSTSRARNGHND
jgi:hypothetical protein